jgi:N-acetylneuraminic acid mutarotase
MDAAALARYCRTKHGVCAVTATPRAGTTGMVSAAYGTFLYQLDGSPSTAPPTTARQWKYATVTDTWVCITAIPSTRFGGASGVGTVGTKMYVLDGPATFGNRKNEAYDTATDTWAAKASPPSDHSGGAVGQKNNKIYVAGGPFSNKVEAYDPVANSWTTLHALPDTSPAQRVGLKGSFIGNSWYVAGGSNVNPRSNEVLGADMITYKYSVTSNMWTTSAPLPPMAGG